jgi:organic hydroperoxide reductase OsmC/OhrA
LSCAADVVRAGREEAYVHDHSDQGGFEVSVDVDTARNGVDTAKMFATLDLIKAPPELARFQFRATNRWIEGAHNRSTIQGFYAAGGEDTSRREAFELDAGEPAILLGTDTGPNPAEYLLHALAACLTTSIVYVAAARKVELTSVESTVTGDMDVRGALGAPARHESPRSSPASRGGSARRCRVRCARRPPGSERARATRSRDRASRGRPRGHRG